MTNDKFEITDIAHETYPFLHRIRALRDIGEEVKAGDLGGFVESEENLGFEDFEGREDNSWIFDDAIAAGNALVNHDAQLRDTAMARDNAYISQGAVMKGNSRAADNACMRGGELRDEAKIYGCGMVLNDPVNPDRYPVLEWKSITYGRVEGKIYMQDHSVIFPGETCRNDSPDEFIINSYGRSVYRSHDRDVLLPKEAETCVYAEKTEQPRRKHIAPTR